MLARCPRISLTKISERTGSISSEVRSSLTGAAGGASGAGSWGASLVMPTASGSPSAKASARCMSSCISARGGVPTSSCSTSSGNAEAASATNSRMGSVESSVWLMTRFSRLSMLHAYSPMRCAPTIRPLPLSVWNDRRKEMSASECSGSSRQTGKFRLMLAISSLASSMNSSTSSGSERSSSTSMTTGLRVAAGAGFGSAGGGSAVSGSVASGAGSSGVGLASSGAGTRSSKSRQRSAFSSMYHGSRRPALTVSM